MDKASQSSIICLTWVNDKKLNDIYWVIRQMATLRDNTPGSPEVHLQFSEGGDGLQEDLKHNERSIKTAFLTLSRNR